MVVVVVVASAARACYCGGHRAGITAALLRRDPGVQWQLLRPDTGTTLIRDERVKQRTDFFVANVDRGSNRPQQVEVGGQRAGGTRSGIAHVSRTTQPAVWFP